MRDFLKVYAPIAILLVAGFAVASRFVNPAPPRQVRMAAGAPHGAYAETAKRYREILARDGIAQVADSPPNLSLVRDRHIEQRALGVTTAAERAAILEQLNRVEAEVCKVHVPLGYAKSHYHLRTHIQFIKRLVEGTRADGSAEG